MSTQSIVKTNKSSRAMIKIPLYALRCILRYPKEKKIICEINTKDIKQLNKGGNLDEIINEARFDYALGNYTAHSSSKSLIAELRS